MPRPLKIMGIHGLGDHRDSNWKDLWQDTIRTNFPANAQANLEFSFFEYDSIFEQIDISWSESVVALSKLLGSGLSNIFSSRSRGFFDSFKDKLRWYAGYVVAWVENEEFRTEVSRALIQKSIEEKPDAILAHSLGSLVCYDTLARLSEPISREPKSRQDLRKHLLHRTSFVTFGSQIGNPFVVNNLYRGRIQPLDVKRWFHLYNEEDDVFTAEIRLPDADNFMQLNTSFDIEGWADHSATSYLKHPATVANLWGPLAQDRGMVSCGTAAPLEAVTAVMKSKRIPRYRVLLVGINEYANPGSNLEGCVNDVYLMSSVLQECGFPAENIRLCLNDRATAKGILDRMHWLLDDAVAGDQLFFFYSGHGAQLQNYNIEETADRKDETLVPFDFDWSPENSVTDNKIYSLYSQLPYDTRLFMMFDCCHSGGIHRQGSLKPRGIDPPDDIRHRSIKWDSKEKMWVSRSFGKLNVGFASQDEERERYCGKNNDLCRIGRAMNLRGMSEKEYRSLTKPKKQKGKKAKTKKIVGPYLPVILEACQESQLAYEYRHGSQSYGAFTYSMVNLLRERKKISFRKLLEQTSHRLKNLGYDQKPAVLGPNAIVDANIPWGTQ